MKRAPISVALMIVAGQLALAPARPTLAQAAGSGEQVPLPPTARAEYERKYLTVTDTVTVSAGESASSYDLGRGKYRKSVRDTDFLRLVGRSDQAQRLEQTRKVQLGLFSVGVIAAGVGTVVEIHHRSKDPTSSPLAGRLSLGSGIAMMVISLLIEPRPLPASEARELADRYNQRLRQRLSDHARARAPRHAVDWVAVPYLDREGGGMTFRGRF